MRPYLRYNPADIGVSEFEKDHQIELGVFPNPAQTYLNFAGIESQQTYSFKMYNISGLLVWEGNLASQLAIPHELNNGIYILSITDDRGAQQPQTLKIHIQR